MDRNEVLKKVTEVVVEQLGVAPEEVREDVAFIDGLQADSLDVIELVMAIEEEFGITVEDEEAEKAKTVGQVVDLICSKLG